MRYSTDANLVLYKNFDVGALLLKGEYLGEVEGQYGTNYQFKTPEGIKTLPGSKDMNELARVHFRPGRTIAVYLKDRKMIKTGKFKGKPFLQFECEYDEDGRHLTGASASEPAEDKAPWEQVESAVTDSKDDDLRV